MYSISRPRVCFEGMWYSPCNKNINNKKQIDKMKNVTILSGNFTGNGNFSGYNEEGVRTHIPQRQMENMGWKKDGDVKYPFYALANEREFNVVDADNNSKLDADGNEIKFQRLQAGSIFKTVDEFIQAKNSSKLLDLKATVAYNTEVTSAGLSEKDVLALLEASI